MTLHRQYIRQILKQFLFCVFLAFSPLLIYLFGVLLGLLLDCKYDLFCKDSGYFILGGIRAASLYLGVFGYVSTIPFGIVSFILGIFLIALSRKNLIKLINTIFLLPFFLVAISGVIWLLKQAP